MAKGFNKTMAKDFTVAMVQAAGAIGVSLDMLAEETRSLLTGTINPRTSRIATVLGLRNEDIRAHSKNAQELFDFLMDRLKAYQAAGAESQKTWAGLWSNFKDIAQQVGGQAFEPLFQALKGWLTEVTNSMVTIEEKVDETGRKFKQIVWNPELTKGIEAFREGLNSVIAECYRLGMLLDKIGGTLTMLGHKVSLGIKAAGDANAAEIGIFQPDQDKNQETNFSKWNKMYEDRYKQGEKALQDMAMREAGMRPATTEEIKAGGTGLTQIKTEMDQILYYVRDQKKGGSKYEQNKNDQADEKVKDLIKKLDAEINKMTLTPIGIIKAEAAEFQKEGAPVNIVNRWSKAKVKEITDAVALVKEEYRIKDLQAEQDYQDKLRSLDVALYHKTETQAIQEKAEMSKQLLLAEQNLIAFKLSQLPVSAKASENQSKERQTLEEQNKQIQKQIDLLPKLTKIELDTLAASDRKRLRGQIGFYDPQYKQEQLDQISRDERRAAELGIQTEAWKKEQIKQIEIKDLEFKIANAETFAEGIAYINEKMVLETKPAVQQWLDIWQEGIQGLQGAFSDLFFDVLMGQLKSFEDYVKSFLASIARAMSDMLANRLVQSLLGSGANLIGSLIGTAGSGAATTANAFNSPNTPAPSFEVNPTLVPHSGCGPYENPDRVRFIDPNLFFSMAHRYHSGIGPHERAAVIRNDESVMTPGQLKQWNEMNSDKGTPTIVQISAVDAKSFVDLCNRNPDVFSGLISKSLKQNKLRNDVKRYGR
jgi:hypothetical protein